MSELHELAEKYVHGYAWHQLFTAAGIEKDFGIPADEVREGWFTGKTDTVLIVQTSLHTVKDKKPMYTAYVWHAILDRQELQRSMARATVTLYNTDLWGNLPH